MNTKILTIVFMLIASFLAKADTSYLHDKAACKFQDQTIQIELKSFEQYSPSADDYYGNLIVINGIEVEKVDSRYRFFSNYNDICSKVLAFPTKEDEIAFFLLKDNRPFTDVVTVLYFNTKTKNSELMQSQLTAKEALLVDGKIYFKTINDKHQKNFGSVVINQKKYFFEERSFEPWMSFDGKNFKFDRAATLDNFEYASFLGPSQMKNLEEGHKKYKVAVSGKTTCFAMDSDPWVCR